MGQASTCAKLHGTNSENHDDSAAVHRMSEESDSGRPNHRTSQGVWCPFGHSIHPGAQVGEHRRQTANGPIEFVV
jgi:hypothetical protein